MNVLYKATLKKIGLNIKDMRAYATTLYGFIGEGIASVGVVILPVIFGEYQVSVTKMVEFIVVDTPSVYNVLLERPVFIEPEAVTSVRHLAMKFPTPKGVDTIKGDQLAAQDCYSISTLGSGQVVAQALVLIDEINAEEEASTLR